MPSRKATRPSDGRLARNKNIVPKRPKTRMQKLIDGEISVTDLDDDEIMQGRVKNSAGNFAGKPREMLPRKLLDALRTEFQKRVQEQFNEGTALALATLQDVMNSRQAAAPARVRAAEVWLERTMGKVPDTLLTTMEVKPYMEDVESLLVDVGEPTKDNVVSITTLGA